MSDCYLVCREVFKEFNWIKTLHTYYTGTSPDGCVEDHDHTWEVGEREGGEEEEGEREV